MCMKFEGIFFFAHENFEEQKKVLGVSHKLLLTINKYYNYIINEQYNYNISNKGPLEECDKEENLEVTGAASTSCLKIRL